MKTFWLASALALGLSGCGPSAEEIARAKHDQAMKVAAESKKRAEAENIKQVEASVTHDMLDPSSVQFRNVRIRGKHVCGELNAKNAYGAYTGFQPFYNSDIPLISASTTQVPEGRALACRSLLDKFSLNDSTYPAWVENDCTKVTVAEMTFWKDYPEACGAE